MDSIDPPVSRLFIYYFSGTGNARNVANWIAGSAGKEGYEVEIHKITDVNVRTLTPAPKDSMIGFCSPTHGFNLPPVMLKFIRRFPRGNKNKVWIVNTRAGSMLWKIYLPGLSGLAQIWAALVLRLKGYRIWGMRPIDLPSNWISIHPGFRSRVVNKMTVRCRLKAENFIQNIISGRKDYRALFDLVQDLLVIPVSIAYYFIGRFFLAKTYYADRNCTACGSCIKNCPVHAIKELAGRPYWTLKCESCMRCMNHCPERAIQTPHGFIALFIYLVFSVGMEVLYFNTVDRYAGEYLRSILENAWIRLLIASALSIPLLVLAYHLMHLLLRFTIFERLQTWTSLTHYKFWRRYRARETVSGDNFTNT